MRCVVSTSLCLPAVRCALLSHAVLDLFRESAHNGPMWNAPANAISAQDIANEHWRVLTAAFAVLDDSDPRSRDVYAALEYFRARGIRQGGINLIAAGLRDGDAQHVRQGLRILRRHLGGIVTPPVTDANEP